MSQPPKFDAWRSETISQLDLIRMRYGEAASVAVKAAFGDIVSERNITAWIGDDSIDVKLKDDKNIFQAHTIHLFPAIFTMNVTRDYIKNVVGALASALESEQTEDEPKIEETVGEVLKTESSDGADAASDMSIERKEELTERLAGAFDGDLAGLLLTDSLLRGYIDASQTAARYRIVSAEKRGNVLYLRTQTEYREQERVGGTELVSVFYDEEIFFIANENRGILIRVFVPSYNFAERSVCMDASLVDEPEDTLGLDYLSFVPPDRGWQTFCETGLVPSNPSAQDRMVAGSNEFGRFAEVGKLPGSLIPRR